MSKRKKRSIELPPFLAGVRTQLKVFEAIIDIYESECNHPHCIAIRQFFELLPAPPGPVVGRRARR